MVSTRNDMLFRSIGGSENLETDLDTVIKCRQLNAHHCRDATPRFNEWMCGKNTTNTGTSNSQIFRLGFLQEPYRNENSNKIANFDRNLNVFEHAGRKKSRAGIVATKNLPLWLISQYTNEDVTTVALKSNDKICD